MKKVLGMILALVVMMTLIVTGCGEKTETKEPVENTGTPADESEAKDPLKVVLMINGTLGDLSFFDSSNRGMEMVKKEFGDDVKVKVVEASHDDTKWEPTLIDLSSQDWDIIIVGTWNMAEPLERVAKEFPHKKYIIFDTSVNYENGDLGNVYSMMYKQNEGAFLAGALAAKVTTSNNENVNVAKKIGFLGGMDIPVINDFLIGYIEGAQYVEPDIEVAISYVGNFNDSAKGKEVALMQYMSGVDVGFNVAGAAGLGQLDAAKELTKYAIGVDADQAMQFKETDPDKSELIITSVLKRVDNSILRAITMHINETLPYGEAEVLGFAENAVGLAENEYYESILPHELRAEVNEIKKKISNGEISVGTAFGMETEELNTIRDSVQ
ncbi:MAG: BMP family ABC transporter substrate-binding protein [Vallitalea sp.]|nr:BMP family ABC transporter substrate-binding protein [Vallitalea sp.]